MASLPIPKGVDSLPRIQIPEKWSAEWFMHMIQTWFSASDVRNAITVGDITITGQGSVPATITVGTNFGVPGTSGLSTGGTIPTSSIYGSGYLVSPSGSVTGIILAPGTYLGQQFEIINESNLNSITFAAAGTSNVADGTSCVISPNRKMNFTWNTQTSLWYHS